MDGGAPASYTSLVKKNILSFGLYIACIVMGALYKNATCNEDLALWNIVFGAVGVFLTLIMIGVQYYALRGTLFQSITCLPFSVSPSLLLT